MKTTYKLIETPPYDKGASTTYWIKKEIVRFGFIKYSKVFGDYKIDDGFGELGDCPFFSKKAAKKRIKTLSK